MNLFKMIFSADLQSTNTDQGLYKIEDLKGIVFQKKRMSLNWNMLRKNDYLSEGDLIYSIENSEIQLLSYLEGNAAEKSVSIGIRKPTIIRVSKDMVREIELSYLTDSIPTSNASNSGFADFDFGDAFQKSISLLSGKNLNQQSKSITSKKDVQTSHKISLMDLIEPRKIELIRSNTRQNEVLVKWKDNEKSSSLEETYSIYLWKQDNSRDKRYDTTQSNQSYVKLRSYGLYYIQIETANGQRSTPIHEIHFEPISNTKSSEEKTIAARHPPNNSLIISKKATKILFKWEDLYCLKENCKYLFTLTDSDGNEIVRRDIEGARLYQKIVQGQYQWQVSRLPDDNSISSYKSPKLNFELKKTWNFRNFAIVGKKIHVMDP